MKQMAFMIASTLCGTAGVFLWSPFYGVFIYYLFAVLRPHYIWEWSLPPGVNWSLYVALATIAGAILALLNVQNPDPRPAGAPRFPPRLTATHGTVLLFAFWIALTYATARSRTAAEPWFIEYIKIFLMYFVSAYLIRSIRQVWALMLMLALTLAYIAYEVNFLYFAYHYLGIWKNGYGGLDNNGAGLMLAMGVPVCWFAFEGLRRWWRWAFLALIPVIVHAVLMTYSRGAMLSLIVVCPFLVLRSRHKAQLGLALAAFVLLAIPMLAGPQIRARFFTIEQNEIDESANSRRAAWKAAWQMALENPVLGVGVRNANLFSHKYGADREGRTIHSQYLQVAADNGLVGLGLYLLMLVAAWLSLRRCRRAAAGRDDPDARVLAACASGIECSLILYSFGSLFLSLEVFELPYLLLLLSAQLAVVSGAAEAPRARLAAPPAPAPESLQPAR
jgi:probable O-glycosylation ligase (exosortase A-associated)